MISDIILNELTACTRGTQIFQNSRLQKAEMKQFPRSELKGKVILYPNDLTSGVCVLLTNAIVLYVTN